MTKEDFILECKNIGIELTEKNLKDLNIYKDLLIEWNKKFNLTTIIDEKDIYLKHFYDSLYILKIYDLSNKIICDFGTGAGFPGLVLAIILPNSNITLIESNNKKIKFLNEVKNNLKLNNVTIINDRVELYAKENREIFDVVTCRAVSSLSIILELSVALLKVNGLFLPMKSNIEDEIKNSFNLTQELGYKLIDTYKYLLPVEKSNRTILKYQKIKKTSDKYPRNYSTIKKLSVK